MLKCHVLSRPPKELPHAKPTCSSSSRPPRGPPTLATSPSPGSRSLSPSVAPGGTQTATRRGCRTRPAPEQQAHGCANVYPRPTHAGQHTVNCTWPAPRKATGTG